MTGKSAAELEREAEAARAGLIQTAEALQNRMTPRRMMDDLQDYFRHSDGALAYDNLKHQVRDNPLPLALVGAGLAWLFMGGGPKSRDIAETAGAYGRTDGPAEGDLASDLARKSAPPGIADPQRRTGLSGTGEKGAKDSTGGTMKSAASKAGSAYESASGRVSSAAGSVVDTASHTGERMSGAARSASSQARHAGSRARRMVSDTFEQEPLIIGALGMAVGAALAAMLPRTKVEEDYVGPYAEKAQESAQDAMNRGVESAKNVANEAVRAGEREAEKQTHRQTSTAGTSAGSPSSTTRTSSRPAAAKPAASTSDTAVRASPAGKAATARPAGKGSEKKS